MTGPPPRKELFTAETKETADRVVSINARCLLRVRDRRRIVVVGGMALAQFDDGDRMAESYAAITLVEQGWAAQNEVAHAFGCSTRTLRRAQERFDEGGLAALGRSGGYPKGRPRLSAARSRRFGDLKAQGLSNRAIAERLHVTEKAVRKQLARLGWTQAATEQGELGLGAAADPNVSASAAAVVAVPPKNAAEPADPSPRLVVPGADPNLSAPAADDVPAASLDTDPADRRVDRLFAHLGLLDDAAPLFRDGSRVPRAGVLLAMPALVRSGVFACAREIYGDIGPAFYGLRTTVVTLLLMSLLRIKRVEGLKEHAPDDLGRLLGLDRAPEVKTLRRKLTRLAALGGGTSLGRALAQRRVAAHGAEMGFLYCDGHVRAYHGKHHIAGTHVARLRTAMSATSDYWVGDQAGEPLFVITAEANAGMVKMLPQVLAEVRALVGDRRVTIVFDRGGWSPKLFREIVASGFDLLTYRKGAFRRIPEKRFIQREAVIDGRKVSYRLADQGVHLLGGRLRLRQVTLLTETGHQTPIITSLRELPDIEVAHRMFERWRQENLFKYLREEYAIDALVDYGIEAADPARDVANPRRADADKSLQKAREEVARLAARYGLDAAVNSEHRRPTMRGFKIANAQHGRELRDALRICGEIEAFRVKIPRRVPVTEALDGRPPVQLATERKHLTNVLKMVAYQAESALVRAVAPHYPRVDEEGRTLVQTALASAADLAVTDSELRVTLAPLSSPHRTKVLTAVCNELNRDSVCFPGTRLRMVFAVTQPLQPV